MLFKPTHLYAHYIGSGLFVQVVWSSSNKNCFSESRSLGSANGMYNIWLIPVHLTTGSCNYVTFHLILQDEHDQLHRGKGGMVLELEAPVVFVDEFKGPGETNITARSKRGEEIFQQYDKKLKENEASHGIHFVICIIIVSTPAGSI